jgi:transposase-like protein
LGGANERSAASSEAWPDNLRQRFLVHKILNFTDKVPVLDREEVKVLMQSAYMVPGRRVAEMVVKELWEHYGNRYPSAMKAFLEDLETCWANLRCPGAHHRYIRTTNVLERAFDEQNRRTTTTPMLFTE